LVGYNNIMTITERQKAILNSVVGEYINSAQPVSSQLLEKRYDFGICPATIRIEMQKLTDAGFIYQPHTSAGRVPTDKGYRFFVDKSLTRAEAEAMKTSFSSLPSPRKRGSVGGDEAAASSTKEEFSEFEDDFGIKGLFDKEFENTIKFIQSLTKNLALASSALVSSYLSQEKILWKEGWEGVFGEPEFKEKEQILNFTKFFKDFEESIENLKINSEIKIYIGKENPFSRNRDFSIIISKCRLPEEEGILAILGPKRMAYNKNIGLIKSLAEALLRREKSSYSSNTKLLEEL